MSDTGTRVTDPLILDVIYDRGTQKLKPWTAGAEFQADILATDWRVMSETEGAN